MSSFALKSVALVLMLLDHIHWFLGFTGVIPQWFSGLKEMHWKQRHRRQH